MSQIVFIIVGTIVFFACYIVSRMITGVLISLLLEKGVLDYPTARSNHLNPTPTAGGIAILFTLFLGFLCLTLLFSYPLHSAVLILGAVFILSSVSLLDDIKGLPILFRFASHILVSIMAAFLIHEYGLVFGGLLPSWLDFILIVFIISWFINVFNFIDGIDGLAGSQAVYLGMAISALFVKVGGSDFLVYFPFLLASVMLGFLYYNWHPAKIIMGDIGSTTMGFILITLLLIMAAKGYWASAVILPMYTIMETGITISRRLLKKEKIWQPHSKHFFQMAVRSGISHAEVVCKIIICDLMLFVIAIITAAIDNIFIKLICILLAVAIATITLFALKYRVPILDIRARRD